GAAAEATAAGAVAIGGDDADKAIASGINSLAFGAGSSATLLGGVAIGQGAQTTTANSVAIGMGSQATTAAVGETSATIGNILFGNTGFAGDAPVGVVSFGSATNERQLVNVAAGRIGATSTDAVNGSQLFAAFSGINNVATTTASALGGGASVDADGSILAPTYTLGGTDYHNVGDALGYLGAQASLGWNLGVNGDPAVNIAPGASIDMSSSSGNLSVSQAANGNLTLGFSDNPTFTSVKTGDTTIDTNGLTIVNGPSITKSGVDAGGLAINNVAVGSLAAGSTQAVNGGQINALTGQIASIFSPTASINPVTGVVNAGLTVGGNSYGTVQAALDQISAGSYTGWTLSAGGRNATIGSGDTVALTSTSGNLTIAQ
ncbi:hypothetical protein BZU93_30430, partial [Salmonella enterica subsp. enterica]|nr:hypothetical protein [Salmonella enterica subsp. enterica serovar Enteritidis]